MKRNTNSHFPYSLFSFVAFFVIWAGIFPSSAHAHLPDINQDETFRRQVESQLIEGKQQFEYHGDDGIQLVTIDYDPNYYQAKNGIGSELKTFLTRDANFKNFKILESQGNCVHKYVVYANESKAPVFSFTLTALSHTEDFELPDYYFDQKTRAPKMSLKIKVTDLMNRFKKGMNERLQGDPDLINLKMVIHNFQNQKERMIQEQCNGDPALYEKRLNMLRYLELNTLNDVFKSINTTEKIAYIKANVVPTHLAELPDEIFAQILAERHL
jgi:hypothetical protein